MLIKIDLHNQFGKQTVRPCEAKIWPAPSPEQNSIKFVNPFTYSNRAIRTVPYTPENVSKNNFSCPTDSAALKNCRYSGHAPLPHAKVVAFKARPRDKPPPLAHPLTLVGDSF